MSGYPAAHSEELSAVAAATVLDLLPRHSRMHIISSYSSSSAFVLAFFAPLQVQVQVQLHLRVSNTYSSINPASFVGSTAFLPYLRQRSAALLLHFSKPCGLSLGHWPHFYAGPQRYTLLRWTCRIVNLLSSFPFAHRCFYWFNYHLSTFGLRQPFDSRSRFWTMSYQYLIDVIDISNLQRNTVMCY